MMSEKKEAKKKLMLPIIVKSEHQREIPKNIQFYIMSFKWIPQKFVNLETGEEVEIKFWTKGGNVPLTRLCNEVGRPIVGKDNKLIGREYGFKALASVLNAIYPCTVEKAKELVQEAVDKQIKHAKLVLKSDLIPTSPNKYNGENEWLVIANYPTTDELQSKINEELKKLGSPLRARFGLKWKLED